MHYTFIGIAVVLFGIQFLFNDVYQKSNGSELKTTLVFSAGTGAVVAAAMFAANGFSLSVTWFSLAVGSLIAINNIAYLFCSMKALGKVNLSVYSVFAMLGGMFLPFVYGILFYEEGLSVGKVICCVLIGVSLFLNVQKGKQTGKVYYFFVFFLNGMMGVFAKFHQSFPDIAANSTDLLLLSGMVSFVISVIAMFAVKGKFKMPAQRSLLCIGGYGVVYGTANLLVLMSLIHLPASVQYPLITGGVIIVSTTISFLKKERLSVKNIAAVVLAFAAMIAVNF